jgi:RIO kinase 1
MQRVQELAHLVEEGVIDAVHSQLMSGKEATVYVVERAGHLGAAKVYRARDDRSFKKVASYTEGRNQTRNSRDRRAMTNKTTYGRGLMEEGWQDMEFRALRAAFDAGVRVPEPFFLYENVLFMELVVDEAGVPARRLADFPFTPEQATALHLEIFLQVKRLLETGRVHADLSAYNVLMAAKGPTIIDMPQVVDVAGNNNAGPILRRDLRNITEHLARFDARLLRFANCGDALFRHCQRGTLDSVIGPEESAPQSPRGGRRGRDAERGRAGREKGPRPERQENARGQLGTGGPAMAHPGGRPPPRPGGHPLPPARPGGHPPARPGGHPPARPGGHPPAQGRPRPAGAPVGAAPSRERRGRRR